MNLPCQKEKSVVKKIMLPSAGYFKTLPCPFWVDLNSCPRPYCHYKHDKTSLHRPRPSKAKSEEKSKSSTSGNKKPAKNLSYKPTPLSLLKSEQDQTCLVYKPTPIKESKKAKKHDIVSEILDKSKNQARFEGLKGHKDDKKSEQKKNSSKRSASKSSSDDPDSKAKRKKEEIPDSGQLNSRQKCDGFGFEANFI